MTDLQLQNKELLNRLVEEAKLRKRARTLYGVLESVALPMVTNLRKQPKLSNTNSVDLTLMVVGGLILGNNPITEHFSSDLMREVRNLYFQKCTERLFEL